MITTAKEFLMACRAGLILAGRTDEGAPEWLGNSENWKNLAELLAQQN